ncbi:MAG TPA: hypothetical protein VEK79_21990 [Thermoanaerobaculia bacterium]|nr:hypothetical protein [Thermoanaerobaculia bacterium]
MKFAHGAILLVLLMRTASADEPDVPRRFEFKFGGQAIWISQRELFTEGGSVRQGILREQDWSALERRRDMKKDGECDVQFIGSMDAYESNVRTWDALLAGGIIDFL